ncbi:TonB-dependent receptor [Henriciella aquimarina]|uniref:TonB-dependent receptor n=1 Tax=Henriciella aquimarina TaxID=545261 RepID=UPI000A07A3BE|nr:TonB-dependent receptor [Henriciella aquimarina]
MFNTSYKTTLLAGAALMAAAPALAQESDEARQEVVVVTASPIRDSQQAAIQAKRDADNVVDIIAADTIGRFPDQTLAAALTRVPGLAVEGDQGEARFVNFRGGRFRYTTISFDGVDVLGAENGRIPRFDSIPAVITSSIEANKAVTPDTPGAPVLGHINIKTFSPFAKEGFGFSATAGAGKRDLNDAETQRYALRASWSNDRFGVLAFGTLDKRDRNVDNREFEPVDTNGDGTLDSLQNLDYRQYGGYRENQSYGAKAEYRPADGPIDRVFASSIFYEFADEEERNQFDFDFAPVALGSAGRLDGVEVTRMLEQGRYETSTFTNTIGLDLDTDGWRVTPRVNYTETENLLKLPLIQTMNFVPISADYDISDIDNPILTPYAPGTSTPVDINSLSPNLSLLIDIYNKFETDSTKAMIDIERSFDRFDTTFKAGFSYDMREADGGNAQVVTVGLPVDVNAYATDGRWDADLTNSIGGVYYRNEALRGDLYDAFRAADPSFSTTPDFQPEEIVSIEEDILAAYAMATSAFDWGNIVYGVRLESTDFSTIGNQVVDGVAQSINASKDYTNLLPSVHFNFDLRDDLKLRLSATSGISRPTYSEARASQSVDPTTPSISGGNPDLDAEESYGFDASLEWYFDEASIASVGAFYRTIDNVIYPGGAMVDGSDYAPGVFAPGEMVSYDTFLNGEDGELSGVEFNLIYSAANFLPSPFDGFGVSGNLTLLDSEFFAPEVGTNGTTAPIPGTSDLIYNASLFYEKYGLSARLSYQWRDAWLSTTESGPNLNQYWDETERLDAKVQYELPYELGGASTVVFFEANNLTDYQDRRYIETARTIDQIESYGRAYMVGLSVGY